jgi:serine/threonine protein kinase
MGITHMDLKPANVLLDDNWEPRLTGFGHSESEKFRLPHDETRETPCGMLSSSPELLSPEEDAYRPSFQSDVYAFAVFIYMCFTPKEDELEDGPFRNWQHFIVKVVAGSRLKRQSSIPDLYWDLIQVCWRPTPDERPTFTEIVQEMRATTVCAVPGTDIAEYQEYQARVCACGAKPLGTDAMLNRICEKILTGWPKI